MTDSRERRTSDPLVQPDDRLKALEARAEIAELRRTLKALPDIEPDPLLWERVQARVRTPARGGSAGRRVPLAMAATVLLAVTAGFFGATLLPNLQQEGAGAVQEPLDGWAENETIRALQARSRQLEPFTRNFETDPAASAFRFRIADVDAQLSGMADEPLSQAEAQRLWGQRVALMESLAEVRRARAALQPAVY